MAEVIQVLSPLAGPVGSTVGVDFVGWTVKSHDECIDVEPLGEFFHDRHEGVEIEGGGILKIPTILRAILECFDLLIYFCTNLPR